MPTTYFPTTTPVSVSDIQSWLGLASGSEFPVGDYILQMEAGTGVRSGKLYINPTYDNGLSIGSFRGAYFDDTPPSAPTNLDYSETTSGIDTEQTLNWTSSTDDYSSSSQISYTLLITRGASSGSDLTYYTWKTPSTPAGINSVDVDGFNFSSYNYRFQVKAFDDAGNASGYSAGVQIEGGLPSGTIEILVSTNSTYGDNTAGCQFAAGPYQSKFIDDNYGETIVPNSTTIYSDPGLTSPFNGASKQWFVATGGVGMSININSSGLAVSRHDCS